MPESRCIGPDTRTFDVILTSRESVCRLGFLDADSFDQAILALRGRSSHPEAAIWCGMCWPGGIV